MSKKRIKVGDLVQETKEAKLMVCNCVPSGSFKPFDKGVGVVTEYKEENEQAKRPPNDISGSHADWLSMKYPETEVYWSGIGETKWVQADDLEVVSEAPAGSIDYGKDR